MGSDETTTPVSARLSRRSEFDLISDLFAPLAAGEPGALGLSDDAAILSIENGRELVVTADAIVSGVHFLPDDPPETVAAKLMGVNLSDLAAMGAEPLAVVSTCVFPKDIAESWIERFAAGLAEEVRRFGVPVVGGDTVSTSGPLTFCLTALGTVPKGKALRRKGAKSGDIVAVSGTIGDGALGLLMSTGVGPVLPEVLRASLVDRYRCPCPRLSLGILMREIASAGMDISDGLIQDLGHICDVSGLGAVIERNRVPLSVAARACVQEDSELWSRILGGGDDYELLLAIPCETWDDAVAAAKACNIPLTAIGTFTTEVDGVQSRDEGGLVLPVEKAGYAHF